MSWKNLLKASGRVLKGATVSTLNYGKSAFGTATNSLLSPIKTVNSVSSAVKTGVGAGVPGYLAWQAIVNDKPVVESVGEIVIGKESIEEGKAFMSDAASAVQDMAEKSTDAISGMGQSINNLNNTVNGGFQSFTRDLFNGNGLNRLFGFFDNIGKGNVSGLSMAGLLAAGLLTFGRFGWLGKIAGVLLSMMIIGNNSSLSNEQAQQRTVDVPQQERSTGLRR